MLKRSSFLVGLCMMLSSCACIEANQQAKHVFLSPQPTGKRL